MGCPAYIPHGNWLGVFYLIWVEIMPRMSVAGRGFELANSPCREEPSSISLYPHGERGLLQPQGHAGFGLCSHLGVRKQLCHHG